MISGRVDDVPCWTATPVPHGGQTPPVCPRSLSGTKGTLGMAKSTTKSTTKVDARRRARERKAILDAEHAEHDTKIEEATVAYFEAQGYLEDLQAQLSDARKATARAVLDLLELGETFDRVATLTDLRATDVRRMRREATKTNADAAADVGSGK